jgi:hypothetical protein
LNQEATIKIHLPRLARVLYSRPPRVSRRGQQAQDLAGSRTAAQSAWQLAGIVATQSAHCYNLQNGHLCTSRRRRVQEFELSVGDAIRIGNRVLTLIDIDGGEVAFRIDEVPNETRDSDSGDSFAPAK